MDCNRGGGEIDGHRDKLCEQGEVAYGEADSATQVDNVDDGVNVVRCGTSVFEATKLPT